jgi:hypothetical protein
MKTLFNQWGTLIVAASLLCFPQAIAQKINISSGSKLVLNNNVSLVVMNGAIVNNGTVVPGNSSSVYFRGTSAAGNISGSATNLNNLYADNSAAMPLNIGTHVSVTGMIGLSSGISKIITNDQLTLKSTYAKTAMVNTIPAGGTISGKVTVERFIQAHRAWHLLTVPITTSQAPTIWASWQEGASSATDNPNPGFGTHITGPTSPANGFDVNPSKGISCKELVSGSWAAINNTNIKKVTDQPGYMIFVRGSRANQLSQGAYAATDVTVLRATGNLNISDKLYPVAATGYTIVGNPYAASIDFATLSRVNVANTFYVWDPMMTGTSGVGAFVTVSYGVSSYSVTASVSPINQYIQSGSAFLIAGSGTAGTITIKETDKSNQSSVSLQRPQGITRELRIDLSLVNPDKSLSLFDGVLVDYDNEYSNDIDGYDAPKLSNGLANVSVFRDGQNLSIERRKTPDVNMNDTVFLRLSQMAIGNYNFKITASNLNYPNTIAYLVDSFLNTQQVVDLNGIINVPFCITAEPKSFAANRFMILFSNSGTLATTFTTLSATKLNKDIALEWRVTNETHMRKYEIERSLAGGQFEIVGSLNATSNNGPGATYKWIDVNPAAGIYFYRIKQLSISGKINYSKIVKIDVESESGEISVNPNLIADKIIRLNMNQQPEGTYMLQLKNNAGQLIYTQKIQHSGGSRSEIISIDQSLPAGIYLLEITGPHNIRKAIKLLTN